MVGTINDAAVWAQLVVTLYLSGLIWCIQIVHYPLMSRIESERFAEFHREHSHRISSIVIVPMVLELMLSLTLAACVPIGVAPALPSFGLVLTAIIWISTFGIQVPLHKKLGNGFDARAHRLLVRSNWVRTIAWSLRAAIAVGIAVTS